MENIQIRTGNNLRSILQTTVSFDNLFTELVKNSLQNNATEVRITYDENSANILDNGTGFDHNKDESGLTEFDKYFVYGNSFTKADKHLNLGQMGVGGKAANDKLSDLRDTHWSMTTKNKHGKSFQLVFKSDNEEYLHEIKPTLSAISAQDTGIPYNTGTSITIHKLNPYLMKHGWPNEKIRENLQQFFNMLYFQTKEQNKTFQLYVNDQQIQFNDTLPGKQWLHRVVQFDYMMNGEKHQASYELKLNKADPREKSLLKCVDLISYTRIQSLGWQADRLNDVLKIKHRYKHVTAREVAIHMNRYLRGYVLCAALSDVKDETGLGAKDLSHHRLNMDHPITQPFLDSLYMIVGNKVAAQLNKKNDPDVKITNILNKVCSIMFKHFNIPDEFITTQENTVMIKREVKK